MCGYRLGSIGFYVELEIFFLFFKVKKIRSTVLRVVDFVR